MSAAVTELDNDSPVNPGEHHSHGPTDGQYFKIFFILVALTALEVSTYWWDDIFNADTKKIAVPVLIALMVIKFFLVALYFMHLKFDSPLLKRTFYAGMVIAIIVYVIMLSVMNFWSDSGTTEFNNPPIDPPAPFCATSSKPGPCPAG
jgi:cytochrome c oxidase subunit 4